MNSTQTLINLFVRRGKDGSIIQWKISSLVVLALVASLVALGAYAGISAGDDIAIINEAPSISENPELKVVQRYAEGRFAQSSWLADNPELKYAQRYSAAAAQRMQTLFGGANPELNAHQRFMAASAQADAQAFQYANPEVRIHQRLVALSRESVPAGDLAENPELKVHRRFAEDAK